MLSSQRPSRAFSAALAAVLIGSAPTLAQPLALTDSFNQPRSIFGEVLPSDRAPRYEASVPSDAEVDAPLPAHLRRQIVSYPTREAPGTIVIDTPNTYLYYVLGGGRAIRYGIGVGREGFTWSGVQSIARKQEWPDWHPPAEMIARQPYLPRFMSGGPGNPLGARAMYLGNSLYRIHGTNAPSTIGQRVSSGCIRLTNEDVQDLYSRVSIGAKVVVLPDTGRRSPGNVASAPRPRAAQPSQEPHEEARQEVRYDEPAFRAPRPQAEVPGFDRPTFHNPFAGAFGSRIY
jgi:lipoprotein-anchoring transpeptidase ErfK/SrfK